jgi:hypothetical protein
MIRKVKRSDFFTQRKAVSSPKSCKNCKLPWDKVLIVSNMVLNLLRILLDLHH